MPRDLLSGMQLAVSLGVGERWAGSSFDEALKRVADVNADYPLALQELLSKRTQRRLRERADLVERQKRALGHQAGATLLDAAPNGSMADDELDHRIATQELRADLPGSGPKRRKPRATARQPAPVPEPDLDPVETT